MAKPLNEFGGWLKFFYIMQWLAAIMGVVFGIIGLLAIFGSTGFAEKSISLFYCLDSAVLAGTAIMLIRILKVKDQQTPRKAVNIILVFAAITVVLAGLEVFVVYNFPMKDVAADQDIASNVKATIKTLGWAAVWISYFKKSKRVISYYGLLSAPQSAPQQAA